MTINDEDVFVEVRLKVKVKVDGNWADSAVLWEIKEGLQVESHFPQEGPFPMLFNWIEDKKIRPLEAEVVEVKLLEEVIKAPEIKEKPKCRLCGDEHTTGKHWKIVKY